jgi:hypothetical protein
MIIASTVSISAWEVKRSLHPIDGCPVDHCNEGKVHDPRRNVYDAMCAERKLISIRYLLF